ncbi:PTP 2 [Bracoviriform demolitoris]|uniref:Tyrosine phosphatase H2 n=1 Tax=Microplitis demolitor bracovirus (isolate Webb) TaxID=654919 RepID=PTPH2_MDBVW|nr:tyrosine-protein phosphatase non-receptor type 9 [Microplitis demolitor]YP_239382.1 PTP 2 [Bracoviriform demolitoris]Q5I146.1 RecName: Full=Tyrosine phosphatase H2; Short=PTP-H2 [Microplitis demolitor bracovirus (isolate Webb)]AAW51786.1 PTP 2 [Bracoviriform demolitoris]KAG6558441.1 protein tyrosine phosphatase H2 [Microplitis demolitor]
MSRCKFRSLNYSEFLNLVEKSDFEEVVTREHEKIMAQKVDGTFNESMKLENRKLNRYLDMLCFDHTRVTLPAEKNRGDYINANYVDGYEYKKKFICTQAPLQQTAYDFWRTVWMHHTRIIVMMCKKKENRKQCFAYWNDIEGGDIVFGKFKITTTQIETHLSYIETTLLVTDGTSAIQEVTHFVFTQWPDYGVPNDVMNLLNFILTVKSAQKDVIRQLAQERFKIGDNPPPIVVHCSAGVGRTGAYCLLDSAISEFDACATISIPSTLINIRNQRYYCIFILPQYFFCYRVMERYVNLTVNKVSKKLIANVATALFNKVLHLKDN